MITTAQFVLAAHFTKAAEAAKAEPPSDEGEDSISSTPPPGDGEADGAPQGDV